MSATFRNLLTAEVREMQIKCERKLIKKCCNHKKLLWIYERLLAVLMWKIMFDFHRIIPGLWFLMSLPKETLIYFFS